MIILIIYPFLRIIMSSCRLTGTITLNYSRPFITTDKILISIHRITMIIWIVKIIRIAGIILTKRFSEITKELAELKKQQEEISAQLRNNQGVQSRIQKMTTVADRMEYHLTEWDEETIRQIIHTVEVVSADQIRVVLTDGSIVEQAVHNQ